MFCTLLNVLVAVEFFSLSLNVYFTPWRESLFFTKRHKAGDKVVCLPLMKLVDAGRVTQFVVVLLTL